MATVQKSEQSNFQDILASPVQAYEEGLEFFRGRGLMNKTLRRLAEDLDKQGIGYCVIGAIALNQHGYRRFTEDIDILLNQEGLEKFRNALVGRGYRAAFTGAAKKFRSSEENVPIEIIVSGEFPGDGRPKPVQFPDPDEDYVVIESVRTLTLPKLIELKLASGMTAPDRLKDLADVQELIRLKNLDARFATTLNPYVRDTFLELYRGIAQAHSENRDSES